MRRMNASPPALPGRVSLRRQWDNRLAVAESVDLPSSSTRFSGAFEYEEVKGIFCLHRLLREMGWKDTDEEDEHYEITEADVLEFENLRRQFQVIKHFVQLNV